MVSKMLSIDRFEGEYAVCFNNAGKLINIHISEIPQGAKEGTILKKENDLYVIDDNETIKKRNEIKKLQDSLWED